MATLPHDNVKTATINALPQNPPTGGAVPPPPTTYSAFYQESTPVHFYDPHSPPPHVYMNTFFCRFISCFAVVVAIVTAFLFIMWSVLKPQIPAFRVDSASIISPTTTGPYLTATWNITLVVTNPNRKLDITYDDVSATVMYGKDEILAHTLLAPFIQKPRAETALPMQFAVVDEFLDNGVAIGLALDRAGGTVRFGLTFWALIRFRAGIFLSRGYILKARCNPLSFAFSAQNGTGALTRRFLCE